MTLLKKIGLLSDFISVGNDRNIQVMLEINTLELNNANDCLILSDINKLDVLESMGKYPSIFNLLCGAEVDASRGYRHDTNKLKSGFYVFGAHKVGASFVKQCKKIGANVLGFFDNDSEKHGKKLNDLEIFSPNAENLIGKSIVIASGRYANEIGAQLAACECTVYNLHEAQFIFDLPHQAEKSFRKFHSDLHANKNKFVSAFLQLDDEKSRRVFDGLLKLRLDLSVSHTDGFKSDFAEEYVDRDFINENDFRRFVDVGSYDGDTLDRLESTLGDVGFAYLFEPEVDPYRRSMEKYCSRENIFVFNFGLSSVLNKFPYFGEYSHDLVNCDYNFIKTAAVQVVELDGLNFIKPSFLKIDVEGAEISVLTGAKNKIATYKPKIAVCCYHRSNDYWEIISFVKKVNPNYKVGMRHYSDILDDTTLYFY